MTRRKPKPGREPLTTEELDRDLARRIMAWAKTWETCVLAGCRRNGRCLHEDACRMIENVDDDWPPEELRIQIYEAIQRLSEDDPAPKYDGRKVR